MNEAVILSAVRTPIGRFLGVMKTVPPQELGAHVIKEAIQRASVKPEDIEEVIMGCVVSAGLGQNPARQAALKAGIHDKIAAMTINKVCGSGLRSVSLLAQAIKAGDLNLGVGGGMESMSLVPYMLPNARNGYRMGNQEVVDLMIHDGLWCAFENMHMGNTGEVVAEKYGIPRQEQDEYAYNSHMKAVAAQKEGRFKDEIIPVEYSTRKGTVTVDTDEAPRADTTVERLARLKPAFKKDGTVTAGNAPGVNDGAAAAVVASRRKAEELGLSPMARIVSYSASGIEPKLVMMAPVEAINMVLSKAGWDRDEVDLYEINEAFSVQAIAVVRELKLNPDKVNVNGGAVALGHPIGATGARILTTLLYAMKARDAKKGVAGLCLGGGNAVAMAVERE